MSAALPRIHDDSVASPCISVCVLDLAQTKCVGCGRTLHEIAAWDDMSAEEKRAVLAALPARLADAATP
ncbi:MAG: DUF1289 domain-containing protein [Casimicrobiaceae bacterium]